MRANSRLWPRLLYEESESSQWHSLKRRPKSRPGGVTNEVELEPGRHCVVGCTALHP